MRLNIARAAPMLAGVLYGVAIHQAWDLPAWQGWPFVGICVCVVLLVAVEAVEKKP